MSADPPPRAGAGSGPDAAAGADPETAPIADIESSDPEAASGSGPDDDPVPHADSPGREAASEADAPSLSEAQLEALLFVAERPLTRREIATIAGVDRATVDARLGDLEVALADRGIRLLSNGERVELATAPEAGSLIARYVGADAVRLSPAALETLAIVAYRQPVTKAIVERIRGVDSDYTIRSLLHRRLVVELGRAETPGRPYLYGTGFDFLERFGLTSLEELPPLDVGIAARLAAEADDTDGEVTGGLPSGDIDASPSSDAAPDEPDRLAPGAG